MKQEPVISTEPPNKGAAQNTEGDEPHSQAPEKLSRQQASLYLQSRWGLSYAVYTLSAYASRGTGPEYQKAGPFAVYTRAALDEWAQSKLSGPAHKASDLKPISECNNETASSRS
jgi:hypothetical protein